MKLVVIHPFLSYQRGDEITDAAKVQEILASEFEVNVVKVAAASEA